MSKSAVMAAQRILKAKPRDSEQTGPGWARGFAEIRRPAFFEEVLGRNLQPSRR
jgi:hypothetical protein